ncbi:WGxxGxxG family protein [Allocoleopsis franciscana]|uniref:WGxxGxxG-CTERM domain-containing protein n=1 Tax=Allocoleopsis franciscana PCC 7113 TaxID=1173027 RepID=K9W9U1_9CYAN|nr:WGxxGxxG family protein [Allocoleopsis franciscana]AFZ17018.1 hypothetical protein Mic7113_1125 [Allocoleopsis franciscana PCC 7113]
MKLSNLSKVVSAGAIAASLAIVPLTAPAQAQTQDTAPGTTYNQRTGDVDTAYTDNDFDWGWLGLLGLAGLAGLLPKKRHETVHYTTQDPDVVARSRSDFR